MAHCLLMLVAWICTDAAFLLFLLGTPKTLKLQVIILSKFPLLKLLSAYIVSNKYYGPREVKIITRYL